MTALALAPELTEITGPTKARVGARPAAPGQRPVRTRPVGKPGNCPAPQLDRTASVGAASVGARGCALPGEGVVSVPEFATSATGAWRLTDRGIAVVLTLAVLLGVAAMVCIGLRAAEVTSADYQGAANVTGNSAQLR